MYCLRKLSFFIASELVYNGIERDRDIGPKLL
jgi:hypothetical protein